MSKCRSCRKTIRWATSAANEKPMPLDEDDERGNVLITNLGGRAHVFKDHATAEEFLEDDEAFRFRPTFFISHHAEGQCAQGPAWQGKQRGDSDEPKPEPTENARLF